VQKTLLEKILYPQENNLDERLDQYIALNLGLSRTFVKRIFGERGVFVNGNTGKPSYRPIPGDIVRVVFNEPIEAKACAQEIPLEILYEDEDLIVVNKPRGMVVHPAAGNPDGTLVNALLAHCKNLSGIGGVLRPGIVHRIDKDTSGILVVAKNDRSHLGLSQQFHDHSIERAYIAIIHGIMQQSSGIISGSIGRHPVRRKEMAVVTRGRHAVTHYRLLEQMEHYAIIEARLETGRTHQIRVHLSYIGHPLVGDPIYGRKGKGNPPINGQALHAALLGFIHPTTGENMCFRTPLPLEMQNLMEWCRNN
jgi:23S rRNA pseudouridine1911/1915/1917 synthase